ncbi:MAG: apolipoprotein N-acyltransferase [Hyphomonadaceae bacterium]
MNVANASAPRSRIEAWFAARTPWQRRGLAAIAGALATLGHAPFQLVAAFIVGAVVLVWLLDVSATQERRLRSAFSIGWFFGFGHFATGLYWVSAAFNVDSEAWGPVWGVPATLALAAGLALFFGVGAVLSMLLWTRDVRRIAAFATGFFVSEWLRGHILTGFPWLLAGYIWAPGEPISQLASVIGIYGLTLLSLLIAATPAAIADGRRTAGRRFGPVLAACLLVGMAWGWGAQRIAGAPIDPPGAQPVVRVADSGLGQEEKWRNSPDQEWRVLGRFLDASGAPSDENATTILVWPEGAVPTQHFFPLDNEEFLSALGRGLGDRVLVTGLVRCEPRPLCDDYWRGRVSGDRLRLFNSAAVIDATSGQARVSQVYDKNHLVPFGEYIPLWSLVSNLNIAPLQRIGAGFESGPRPSRLIVPGAPPAVVLICYEAIFPGMIPHGDERPGWIVMVTNDAWFGGGSGPYQHYAMARYRAIEEGLPVARAASGGVSAIVDSFGRELQSSGETLFAEAQLPPALPETPWVHWGSILLAALFVLILGLRFLPAGRQEPGGLQP